MATKTKVKKKIFVKILAPKLMQEEVFGEAPVIEPRSLLGKNMRINLMGITNDPRDQNTEIKLNINSLKGDSVGTEIVGYTLLPSYIRKMVRKEKRRVDDCFTAKTADGKSITIKPFLLTIHITPRSVLTALRKKTQELVKAEVVKLSFEALLTEVLTRRLQDKLRKDLAKIYPLKQCEIRDIQIFVDKKKGSEQKEEIKVEELKVSEQKEEVKVEESKEVSEKKE